MASTDETPACAAVNCDEPSADTPEQTCGGTGTSDVGCGELFCDDHLYFAGGDGFLCDADYHNRHRETEEATDGH